MDQARIGDEHRNRFRRFIQMLAGLSGTIVNYSDVLRVDELDVLRGHPQMGRSWEGMVVEQVLRGLAAGGIACDHYHYRTAAGAKVDLVLEGTFALIPVEVKYPQTTRARELRPISDFIEEQDCRLGFVINNDERPRLCMAHAWSDCQPPASEAANTGSVQGSFRMSE